MIRDDIKVPEGWHAIEAHEYAKIGDKVLYRGSVEDISNTERCFMTSLRQEEFSGMVVRKDGPKPVALTLEEINAAIEAAQQRCKVTMKELASRGLGNSQDMSVTNYVVSVIKADLEHAYHNKRLSQ